MLTARAIVADSADTAPDEVLAQSRAAGWDEAAIEAQRTRGWNMFQRMIFTLPRSYVRIADGETLDMGAHRWRVVTGSGHSPEHACLRSEEHTSELQSLMRISYAVFCLKKKKQDRCIYKLTLIQ